MMANKHLHELLKEDQEPFFLKNYIDDRRSQLKRTGSKTTLQVKKRKPIVESSNSKRSSSLCQQACFFTFVDSPDVRKSPFLDFPSPAKSPCKTPNGVLLHVPAKTAALLLEAAMRIQKQSSSPRPKTQSRNLGFALFGSILKRLSGKNRSRKREIAGEVGRIAGEVGRISARKSAGKSEKVQENVVAVDEKGSLEMGFSCSCSNSRRNSGVWSESNEEKSLDMESSSSCRSEDSEERENGSFALCDKRFCSSPFRFALQNSSPSGNLTPNFSSPATSPRRLNNKQEENCQAVSKQKNHPEEEEEEKEQCSPVSVLDPLFEDKGGQEEDGDNDHEEGYDLECSYAIVQKAKQQLLQKLRRFEKLAELDPVELERRMLEEQDEDENEGLEEDEECEEDDDSLSLYAEKNVDELVREVLNKSGICEVSADMKRLVLDLIAEEKISEEGGIDDSEVVVKRVCRRLDSWKEVESNTIDMMVELDFRRELEGWKRNDQEQMRQTATEIEHAIFGLLVGELSEELICFTGV